VNPKYPEIAGYTCHPTLDRIDGDCDLAVIALPAGQVPAAIGQCADRGIGYAVVLGGGFRESGDDGIAIENDMLAVARAACASSAQIASVSSMCTRAPTRRSAA